MSEHFNYYIKRQRRKTMALHVLADATVEVRVPEWVAKSTITQFVEQRSSWVVQQRQMRLQKLSQKPAYRDQAQHYFLGERRSLSIASVVDQCPQSGVVSDKIQLKVRAPASELKVEKALLEWYRAQAARIFTERLLICYESFPSQGLPFRPLPKLIIRKMRRRWGSCSRRGEITLNLMLIRLPIKCIDFVINHELCHLWVFNHSQPFYNLLDQAMSEWRECEALIEQWDL